MRSPSTPWILLLVSPAAMYGQGTPDSTRDATTDPVMRVIETARTYDEHLPNFVCKQVTHRAKDESGTGARWKEYDSYEAEITYFGRREGCRLLKLNGKPSKRNCREIGGYRAEGMFASLASWIFRPVAQAEFAPLRQEATGSRATQVLSYHVLPEHSLWQASAQGKIVTKGFHGLVWAELATDSVVRIHAEPDADAKTQIDVEYDFVDISGERFLLPIRAEARTSSGRSQLRNTVDYMDFHRYVAETSVKFGESSTTGKQK